MKIYAIIPSAGAGSRMGANNSKALIDINGKSSIRIIAEKFKPRVDKIIVVIRKEELTEFKSALYGIDVEFVIGGDTRRESVHNALNSVKEDYSIVLVHDGARPLLSLALIDGIIKSTIDFGAAVPVLPVSDTLKYSYDGEYINYTKDRANLYTVQTPQGFNAAWLKEAYTKFPDDATDDAALIEKLGHRVKMIKGEIDNIKLTYPRDVSFARRLSGFNSARTGFGFDVHTLVEGRKLILCGVNIPYTKGLLGHSDADVALHALMDALLGAAALGDIGKHFPDNDKSYKDISSITLLKEVKLILAEASYMPYNVDVCIAAQEPKLSPYIEAMRKNISEALEISTDMVSVKATTTEKLGFVGRLEGICAYANVSVICC
ncbi:MAG TPA: 2-C-methyl-D-erythritol 2,4-cyclodiphosphate synthase [Christensenellaceae bacterium]|nr:2-C-methyl-D-erythritol 2,4-cyclodiphosphate synthase [Christensenellaceae bacterium]